MQFTLYCNSYYFQFFCGDNLNNMAYANQCDKPRVKRYYFLNIYFQVARTNNHGAQRFQTFLFDGFARETLLCKLTVKRRATPSFVSLFCAVLIHVLCNSLHTAG